MIGGIFNLISNSVNAGLQNQANKQNYQAQQDALAWQKEAQKTTWSREDNAVQRRVADLKAAGLSPVLAAGSGAQAGPAVKIDAPQRQADRMPSLDAADAAQVVLNLMRQKEDISNTRAQNELLRLQAAKSRQELGILKHDAEYYKNSALPSNAPPSGIVRDIGTASGVVEGVTKDLWNKAGRAVEGVTGKDAAYWQDRAARGAVGYIRKGVDAIKSGYNKWKSWASERNMGRR